MAHQWFGDYVTCKDWSHLWLNEGFATLYAHLYEGHKFGRDAMLYGLHQDARQSILPQGDDTRPIVFNRYKNASEQFDFRAYPKGSWVLHMLRCQLGPDLFRRCVKTFLHQHQYATVVTADFLRILEELSGRAWDQFFDQWVYHAGHPVLNVRYEHWQEQDKLAKVTIQQTQPVNEHFLLFEFPTKLRFVVDQAVIDREILGNQPQQEFYVSLPAQPTIVIPAGEWKGKTQYGEWIRNNAQIPLEEYDRFVGQFNPVKFNARAWVQMAKNAGMKYIVITSKDHNGFWLFDSKETEFDVMATAFRRDILKELSEACGEADIKLCFYHSIMDWHHPDYLPRRPWEEGIRSAEGADFDRYVAYMKSQLKELMTNYGPLGVLWFDGEWESTLNEKYGLDLYQYVRGLQPSIIINNRVGAARCRNAYALEKSCSST